MFEEGIENRGDVGSSGVGGNRVGKESILGERSDEVIRNSSFSPYSLRETQMSTFRGLGSYVCERSGSIARPVNYPCLFAPFGRSLRTGA